jgi:peptidyl-tRNA hydrolase, PTH1 family
MRIIAGLGNPGPKYENHRHNVGFMAADAIARRHSFSPWSKKFQGLVAEGFIGDEKVLLIKPQTFMNLSGQSVGEAIRFYKLGPQDLTVLYDELDLAPAKVRVKTGGGAGGHNGIRSLDAHCGKEYRRVRIGIGHPGVKELVLDAIAEAAPMLVKGDDNGFMNKVSLAVQRKAPATRTAPQSTAGGKPAAKGQSHIRQARPRQTEVKVPETGPMAAMLKKLFGKD